MAWMASSSKPSARNAAPRTCTKGLVDEGSAVAPRHAIKRFEEKGPASREVVLSDYG